MSSAAGLEVRRSTLDVRMHFQAGGCQSGQVSGKKVTTGLCCVTGQQSRKLPANGLSHHSDNTMPGGKPRVSKSTASPVLRSPFGPGLPLPPRPQVLCSESCVEAESSWSISVLLFANWGKGSLRTVKNYFTFQVLELAVLLVVLCIP